MSKSSKNLSKNELVIFENFKIRRHNENKLVGKRGGGVAKIARIDLEQKTGKKIVSGNNFLSKGNIKRLK